MSHFAVRLPERIELGALRAEDWGTEVVTTDSGHEVRNNRWSAPLRTYEISLAAMRRDDEDYIALRQIWQTCEGGLHTFELADFTDDGRNEIVTVRFASPLQITALDKWHDHIDSFTLIEVRG